MFHKKRNEAIDNCQWYQMLLPLVVNGVVVGPFDFPNIGSTKQSNTHTQFYVVIRNNSIFD